MRNITIFGMALSLGFAAATPYSSASASTPATELSDLLVLLAPPASVKALTWRPATNGRVVWQTPPTLEAGGNSRDGEAAVMVGGRAYPEPWIVLLQTFYEAELTRPPDIARIRPGGDCNTPAPSNAAQTCLFDIQAVLPKTGSRFGCAMAMSDGTVERKFILTAPGRRTSVLAFSTAPNAPNVATSVVLAVASQSNMRCTKGGALTVLGG